MSSREHAKPSPTAVVISGALGDELRRHAFERCRHFFLYLFYYKALLDRVNGPLHNLGIAPTAALYVNATHQIDTGFRSGDPAYYGFDARDPNVVTRSATACGRMDAAHFCNLGIQTGYGSRIAPLASTDAVVFRFWECLKTICGNTRLLPQRVNIGPDKRIDAFHGDLATAILSGGQPVVSVTNLRAYLQGATQRLTDYQRDQAAAGNLGIVACVDAYLACYAHDGEALWQFIRGNVESECAVPAYGLTAGNYLAYL